MGGDSLVQAAPWIAIGVVIAVVALVCPRAHWRYQPEPAPVPEVPPHHLRARELVTEATRLGHVDRWGVRVLRTGTGWVVNGVRYTSARQAEVAARRLLERAA